MKTNKLIRIAAFVVAAFGFAGNAHAVTPANALLTNQATLTYTGNASGIQASVSVEVQLVTAGVTAIVAPIDVTLTEGQAYSDTFIIQSNANGPDSYDITGTVTDGDADITGEDTSVTFTTLASTFTLGASALAAAVSTSDATFTVPGDGTNDGEVNGLAAGDFFVLNGKYYQIESVAENAGDPTQPATITIDTTPTGPAALTFETSIADNLTLGEGVYEFVSFTADLDTVGTQTTPGTEGEIELNLNITNGETGQDFDPDTGQTTADARVVITVVRVEFDKYVRNVTADNDGTRNSFEGDCTTGGGETVTYQTEDYYLTEGTCVVEVLPADTLEYYLRIKADDNADIAGGVVSDDLPDFTTYAATTTKLNNQAVDDEGGGGFPLDSGADDGGLLIQDDAATAQAAGAEGSGDVTQAETAHVVYQITVDDT